VKGFGTFLVIIGLAVALFAVLGNQESSYDTLLRENRSSNSKSASELKAMRDAGTALADMSRRKMDTTLADSVLESSRQSIDGDTLELAERERARNSSRMTGLVVAGVLVVLGFLLRSRQQRL
jgi:hypothetical protein